MARKCSAKEKQIVAAVKRGGSAVNPYAVAKSTMKKSRRKKGK